MIVRVCLIGVRRKLFRYAEMNYYDREGRAYFLRLMSQVSGSIGVSYHCLDTVFFLKKYLIKIRNV